MICTDHVSTYCTSTSRTAGRCWHTSQRQRSSRHQNLPTPGDATGNPSAGYRETKMLAALREDPVTSFKSFSSVVWHPEHVREWLWHSAAPCTAFTSVLFKDTLDQTCTSKIQKVLDVRPPTSETAFEGLKKDAHKYGLNQPPF